jgi:hypothetical protein
VSAATSGDSPEDGAAVSASIMRRGIARTGRQSFHVMQITSCPIGFDGDLRARYAENVKIFNDRKEF